MKQKIYVVLALLGLMAARLSADTISYTASATTWNLQSYRGVPVSSAVNTNIGSDGRMVVNTTPGDPAYTLLPTASQFASMASYGAVFGVTNATTLTNYTRINGSNAFSGSLARDMQLNIGTSNNVVGGPIAYILRRPLIGAAFYSAPVTYNFGSVIAPPQSDENGVPLTANQGNYWQQIPRSASNGTNDPYYYSPNAGVVFATQPGQVAVTWVTFKTFAPGSVPAYVNPGDAANSYQTNGSTVSLLYTAIYVVAGVPNKPPQNMYWTEGGFVNAGLPIQVPSGRIANINVVFSSAFPETVTTPFADPYQLKSTNEIPEYRTLWYDPSQKLIKAYNAEGLVFVEILGAATGPGASLFLGYEIVSVRKTSEPADVSITLGERVTPFADGFQGIDLDPWVITGNDLLHFDGDAQHASFYAQSKTFNPNEVVLYWLSTGVGGLKWPNLLCNYSFDWPSDPGLYSWYSRPVVSGPEEASSSAVPLTLAEDPTIVYQDALDQTRGFMTAKPGYYSWLTRDYPAHRALILFHGSTGFRLERVFSVLTEGLENNAILANSGIATLSTWNPVSKTLTNSAGSGSPVVVNQTATVGQRLSPPSGELGSTNGTYWAGWINTNLSAGGTISTNGRTDGLSYNPEAYIDPFISGFAAANLGAIIPVNAIPGDNTLLVWWFRQNKVDSTRGMQPVYWPSVIARYTLQWPTNAPKIVLANNAGTGPLIGPASSATIYTQNDPALPGYNPNEEHAVMLGGQGFALRTDLNQTNYNAASPLPLGGYSSAPFVLLNYIDTDGRPSMAPYQVLAENPAAGEFFDYVVAAGKKLEMPMPLPLLSLPLKRDPNSPNGFTNYNTAPSRSTDLPVWSGTSATNTPGYSRYSGYTFQDRNNNFWVHRGPNAGLPALVAGSYNTNTASFTNYLPGAVAVLNSNFNSYIHVSRLLSSLTIGVSSSNLPSGLKMTVDSTNGLCIRGIPNFGTEGSYTVEITLQDTDDSKATVYQPLIVRSTGPVTNNLQLVIVSTNQYSGTVNTYSNRPPTLAAAPTPTNSFIMRFYYKTMAGFAWPELGADGSKWPAVGSIVPYGRPQANGVYAGSSTNVATASLPIVYRPVWPTLGSDGKSPLPQLKMGQTLTTPISGLTAIRGQDSVELLYQQAIATAANDYTNKSVVLYDPTSQKKARLDAFGLAKLPASMVTEINLGLYYFPKLSASLISRFWYDGQQNALIFQGQFVADPVNDDYVMLNVLRGDDLAAAYGLCPSSDPDYAKWKTVVDGLALSQTTFGLNSNMNYVINTSLTVARTAGALVEVTSSDAAVDSLALSAVGPSPGYISYVAQNDLNPKLAGNPVSVVIVRVVTNMFPGSLVLVNSANASPFSQIVVFQHTADLAGNTSKYTYDWRISPPGPNGDAPLYGQETWPQIVQTFPGPLYTLGAQGVQGLIDNFVSMRYGYTNPAGGVVWSPWPNQSLFVPGWIKRVTQSLNPVSGGAQNLLQNPAATTASIIALAGSRWVGNVPLNAASLTNSGMIQLYETVLNTGKELSINAAPPINYGLANQALLLASGYLNDFYTILGNDAWANSQNPTIGFGSSDSTYGSVATSSFVFEGQEPTLLAQNLSFLRGRNDSVSPGVNVPPVYNHLWWNYTYGISAGETIYALNYNITDQDGSGVVNANDARIMYPQGHGDAYGHYLTALGNYYTLLLNPSFDWVPRAQVVSVLGAAVAVNYQDEQKFATTAAALARTGEQIFNLTFRESYLPGTASGWSRYATTYSGRYTYKDPNNVTRPITTYWGLDHWASRVGQGNYLNWVVGNSILPSVDDDPNHQGIQKVDRTTVTALQELPATAEALERDMDNANAGYTPLGLAQNAIPFDINPQQVTGANPQSHFEQVYARAVQALDNAKEAFDAAQGVTENLRRQQNSMTDLKAAVDGQERAYNNQLIELYGTPYTDDIGPGTPNPQGYTGPDLVHFMYVEGNTNKNIGTFLDPDITTSFVVNSQALPFDWGTNLYENFDFLTSMVTPGEDMSANPNYLTFNIGANGFQKPAGWTGKRLSTGSIQRAAAAANAANDALRQICYDAQTDTLSLLHVHHSLMVRSSISGIVSKLEAAAMVWQTEAGIIAQILTAKTASASTKQLSAPLDALLNAATLPSIIIAGTAVGGDQTKAAMTPIRIGAQLIQAVAAAQKQTYQIQHAINIVAAHAAIGSLASSAAIVNGKVGDIEDVDGIAPYVLKVGQNAQKITQAQASLQSAQANYDTLLSQGMRLQQERLTFRRQAAAKVQGATVANAAFLVFQNEDLQRYNTLFNLAAEYAYMAANAFDYETGLLGTPAGQAYLNQIISSSALGVIDKNGVPQISGTTTGDPGLANALAEMKGDFDVLKGRLGFNNPDGYGTISSLRTENYRINADSTGDNNWKQVLQQGLMADVRTDSDVLRNCLQIDNGSGQAVPGIVLSFSTTITDGQNLFGQILGPGDHSFSSSSFATKIFALGVNLDGYVGMDNPISNSGAGGTSPSDPTLDPNGLAATPYVYLIPCGSDSMRSPPLGDTSTIRTWNVNDVAIPLPYNIGASGFSDAPFYQAANSLTEPLYAIRKQQAFRPVSSLQAFNTSIYGATGSLQPSQYTNQRLIGRSVWNSQWKLVIPGKNLLADPNQGLARFINSVKDIHLNFVTYSYSGN